MHLYRFRRYGDLGDFAGRARSIFDYIPSGIQKAENSGFLFLVVINAVVAVWAAPAVSASDFTQNAHSFREQALGQTLGLVVAYILFCGRRGMYYCRSQYSLRR